MTPIDAEVRPVALIALAASVAVALVLAGGALIMASGSRAAASITAAPASAASTTITATLSEFAIAFSASELAAGPASITIDNVGAAEHDLVFEGTDSASPTVRGASSAAFDVDLQPGTYTVYCSLPGHRQAGMETTLEVVGEGASATPASASGHGGHGADTDWAALDAAMHDSILAFPAETAGVGNQVLEPEILADGTKRFELVAEIIEWEVEPGRVVEGWAYNGQIPGPMIRLDVGDKVEIAVTNKLPLGTDVHWHGIMAPNQMDGVAPLTQDLIAPGETFTYRFVPQEASVSMYHPHHHAQLKIPNGMWGTIIVGDLPLPEGRTIGGITLPDEITVSQEVPMVLNDAGTIGLSLNGKSFPATAPLVAEQGDWLLIHYYNEGLQVHPMHLHGQPQLVIAKDGFPLDAPRWEDTVNVAPGERFSVLVQAKEPGVWAFHCHILTHAESDEGMFGMVTALIVQ
jgi:manganese oxidase